MKGNAVGWFASRTAKTPFASLTKGDNEELSVVYANFTPREALTNIRGLSTDQVFVLAALIVFGHQLCPIRRIQRFICDCIPREEWPPTQFDDIPDDTLALIAPAIGAPRADLERMRAEFKDALQ
jgi:hypothetical protein